MSRRLPQFFTAVALLLLICACGSDKSGESGETEETIHPVVTEKMAEPKLKHKFDGFEMKLNIDKTDFKIGEPIELSASLNYIGEEDAITVWGPRSKVIFTLTDGKEFDMEGASTMDLVPLEIAQGETLEFPFSKSGGYDSDDPDAEFWKKFYAEKELLLPAGT
ncbi:hypothetical protein [Paenibacillus prosopidis]|uniref:Intracellular proteinase inhibitor BsuPI n=1 Tax=Paenibacillus prosopidis TaxID=630520 RepID=A0A368VEV5_9BACL|nr:hypothetical protein [Paenibacillus prosopidis]RCW39729.1 hypothetical protein DFP97_1554 [Paenibacillus prosopidis]